MGSFKPADFSDIEEELYTDTVKEKEKVSDFIPPTKPELNELRERFNLEMKKVEQGVSQITKRNLQAEGSLPSKNFIVVLFDNFSEKTLDEFILLLKEDYGYNMAKWVCEITSPWHPTGKRLLSNGHAKT